MKELITLENVNTLTIYQVFEDAFSDYFVKFEKGAKIHLERWINAGVDFTLSYGVKVDARLVGFLLHAPRGEMVMNLATGVRKEFQGKGLTSFMYEGVRRDLPMKGFRHGQLEVITENARAIRVYERNGFRKKRKLLCWRGTLTECRSFGGDYDIKIPRLTAEHAELTPYPWAFEQSSEVIARKPQLELHELRDSGELLAFSVWNPLQMNFVQLGARDEASLETLLAAMKLSRQQAGVINVDERHELLNRFLSFMGMENFVSQYEMEMDF